MAIYNRLQFYKEALDSLAKQTDKNFELLIYSNIPVEYDLSKFKDATVIENAPVELGLKYAYGIRKAKYDKIAFLEDDDTFAKNKVEYLNNTTFGYLHNAYFKLSDGEYNYGRGFNMSSIAICRTKFKNLAEQLESNEELGKIPDSFIYWTALEQKVNTTIINEKLTGYRFRDYKTLQGRVIEDNKKQLEYLKIADKYFKNPEVKRIIKSRMIANKVFLNSYGLYSKISLVDMLWLLKQKDVNYKISKIISYVLSLPLWKGKGIKFIKKLRDKKSLS